MKEIPRFKLFSESFPQAMKHIQPQLPLRQWEDISEDEKRQMFEELVIREFPKNFPNSVFTSVNHLNTSFLRVRPGKNLHEHLTYRRREEFGKTFAARKDFKEIFVHEKSHHLVFEMLSVFARCLIKQRELSNAEEEQDPHLRAMYVRRAYSRFDRLEKCLNNIFEQFGVNMSLTRLGFVPMVDEKIQEEIYQPVLKVLSDPKWESVSADLSGMFNEYHVQDFPETITKASSTVHRFLQILVGEEGKNRKGDYGKLFTEAKRQGLISNNRFIEGIITTIKGFIPGERANKSSAKPVIEHANSSDALLVMNVVMILLQHCLQNLGELKTQ